MTRFALGAKCGRSGRPPVLERVSAPLSSEASAAVPSPTLLRAKKCRRVMASLSSSIRSIARNLLYLIVDLIEAYNETVMKVVPHPSKEGLGISCPGLPGCWSQGSTEQEALKNIQDAISEYLDV